MKLLRSYTVRAVFYCFIISAAVGVLASLLWWHYELTFGLNFEALSESLVNINTGIVIAIFIALFHSTNKNMENFKKFIKSGKQLYMIFICNCLLVGILSVVVVNTSDASSTAFLGQQSLNVLASVAGISLTIYNIRLVYNLLAIYFRT